MNTTKIRVENFSKATPGPALVKFLVFNLNFMFKFARATKVTKVSFNFESTSDKCCGEASLSFFVLRESRMVRAKRKARMSSSAKDVTNLSTCFFELLQIF